MSTTVDRLPALVGVGWLRSHIADRGVLLLDARVAREVSESGKRRYRAAPSHYEEGHIPGARFADLVGDLSDPSTGLNFTLPATGQLEAAFRTLGVDNESAVIAYDDETGLWAARVWWLLRALGHRNVSVLNGGLSAWAQAGGELVAGPAGPATNSPGDFDAHDPSPRFATLAEIKALSDSGRAGTVLNALDRDVFTGERPSGAARDGHIPGSRSFPYAELLNSRRQLDPSLAPPVLAELGLDPGDALVTYCGGGITACGTALALVAAGYEQVRVYDGSLQEWADDPTTALELGD